MLPALTAAISPFRPCSASSAWERAIAETLQVLAELIALEAGSKPAEPHYCTAVDRRGTSFGPGAPIPYRRGTALYRVLAIFRDCASPITASRFVELGGRLEDLEILLEQGKVVQLSYGGV